MQRDADDRICREILAKGSRSFSAASWLLAKRLRRPVAALYAFCRVADDAIDDGGDPDAALVRLALLLDRVYAGTPGDDAVERSLARVVHEHGVARPVLDALLDGFASDVRGDRIEQLDDLLDYAVRVASTVGLAMTLVMGVRDRPTLARATDLGVAMQLTNIARDVGEDARRGRVYLPAAWFAEVGIDRDAWLAAPRMQPGIAAMVERALVLADEYYRRADLGIAALPRDCQAAIRAARWIYADIGRVIRGRGCDSVTGRARTSTLRKLVLLLRTTWTRAQPPMLALPPAIPLASALVDACTDGR
jgi:phytoene synthase